MQFDYFLSGSRLPFNLAILLCSSLAVLNLILVFIVYSIREKRAYKILIEGKKPNEYGWDVFQSSLRQLEEKKDRSLLAERAQLLDEIRKAENEIDSEALAAVALARIHRKAVLSRYSVTAAILIGLLGTLYGLSQSVHKIRSLLVSGDQAFLEIEKIKEAVFQTTEGMSTAFYTTFAGVFAAILLGFALSLYRRWELGISANLEETSTLYLVPACQTSEASTIAESARSLRNLQENLAEGVKTLLGSFEERSQEIRDSLTENAQTFLEGIKDRSDGILDEFQTTIQSISHIIGESEENVPSLAQQVRYFTDYTEKLDNVLTAHQELNQDLEKRFREAILRQADDLREVLGEQNNRIEGYTQVFRSYLEQMELSVEFYKKYLEDLGRISENLSNASSLISDKFASFSDLTSVQWRSMSQVTLGLKGLVSESGTAFAGIQRRLEEQLLTFRGEIEELLQMHQSRMDNQNIAHLNGTQAAMRTIEQEFRNHLMALEERLKKQLPDLSAGVGGLSRAVNELREQVSSLKIGIEPMFAHLKDFDERVKVAWNDVREIQSNLKLLLTCIQQLGEPDREEGGRRIASPSRGEKEKKHHRLLKMFKRTMRTKES